LATPGAAAPSVEFDGSRSTGNGGGTGPVDFLGMFHDVSAMRFQGGRKATMMEALWDMLVYIYNII
jgi:hypothetical protein